MAGPHKVTPLEQLTAQLQQLVTQFVIHGGASREATTAAVGALDVTKTIISDPKWIKQLKQMHRAQAQQATQQARPTRRNKRHP
ncbi:MAG: hypothetical protein KBE09_01905 [Candidatus Pacebacteria bacterium]|nr:hypothetical protein [Candidatus Paceibacterota bacterium]